MWSVREEKGGGEGARREEKRDRTGLGIARIVWDQNPKLDQLDLLTIKPILLTKKIVSFKIALLQEQ